MTGSQIASTPAPESPSNGRVVTEVLQVNEGGYIVQAKVIYKDEIIGCGRGQAKSILKAELEALEVATKSSLPPHAVDDTSKSLSKTMMKSRVDKMHINDKNSTSSNKNNWIDSIEDEISNAHVDLENQKQKQENKGNDLVMVARQRLAEYLRKRDQHQWQEKKRKEREDNHDSQGNDAGTLVSSDNNGEGKLKDNNMTRGYSINIEEDERHCDKTNDSFREHSMSAVTTKSEEVNSSAAATAVAAAGGINSQQQSALQLPATPQPMKHRAMKDTISASRPLTAPLRRRREKATTKINDLIVPNAETSYENEHTPTTAAAAAPAVSHDPKNQDHLLLCNKIISIGHVKDRCYEGACMVKKDKYYTQNYDDENLVGAVATTTTTTATDGDRALVESSTSCFSADEHHHQYRNPVPLIPAAVWDGRMTARGGQRVAARNDNITEECFHNFQQHNTERKEEGHTEAAISNNDKTNVDFKNAVVTRNVTSTREQRQRRRPKNGLNTLGVEVAALHHEQQLDTDRRRENERENRVAIQQKYALEKLRLLEELHSLRNILEKERAENAQSMGRLRVEMEKAHKIELTRLISDHKREKKEILERLQEGMSGYNDEVKRKETQNERKLFQIEAMYYREKNALSKKMEELKASHKHSMERLASKHTMSLARQRRELTAAATKSMVQMRAALLKHNQRNRDDLLHNQEDALKAAQKSEKLARQHYQAIAKEAEARSVKAEDALKERCLEVKRKNELIERLRQDILALKEGKDRVDELLLHSMNYSSSSRPSPSTLSKKEEEDTAAHFFVLMGDNCVHPLKNIIWIILTDNPFIYAPKLPTPKTINTHLEEEEEKEEALVSGSIRRDDVRANDARNRFNDDEDRNGEEAEEDEDCRVASKMSKISRFSSSSPSEKRMRRRRGVGVKYISKTVKTTMNTAEMAAVANTEDTNRELLFTPIVLASKVADSDAKIARRREAVTGRKGDDANNAVARYPAATTTSRHCVHQQQHRLRHHYKNNTRNNAERDNATKETTPKGELRMEEEGGTEERGRGEKERQSGQQQSQNWKMDKTQEKKSYKSIEDLEPAAADDNFSNSYPDISPPLVAKSVVSEGVLDRGGRGGGREDGERSRNRRSSSLKSSSSFSRIRKATIFPDSLTFPIVLNKLTRVQKSFDIINNARTRYLAFKVKTNALNSHLIDPKVGIISAGSSVKVNVVVQGSFTNPVCNHIVLIRLVHAKEADVRQYTIPELFRHKSAHVSDKKMKCFWSLSPAATPSTVASSPSHDVDKDDIKH
eukprot:jgi/Bigna1/80927/fgenesh1_pg.75_\